MVKSPTVLILSAGASTPYGFPSGAELKRRICEQFADEKSALIEHLTEQVLTHEPLEFVRFQREFRKSGCDSIDTFLEHRPDLREEGKLAIAACLIPFEDEEKLFAPSTAGDWYTYLFTQINGPLDQFVQSQISIVTFNYDRSLEQFLWSAVQRTHHLLPGEAAEVVRAIPIVHVYGQLGNAPYDQGGRLYKPELPSLNDIRKAAEEIRIIPEGRDESASVVRARELMRGVNRICFLGFGYHEQNVRRLGFDPSSSPGPALVGTSLGLELGEKQTVRALVGGGVILDDVDCLTLLRRYQLLS